MALLLSEATFDQLVELPVVGPTRAQQFLELREEVGGEVTGWLQTTQPTTQAVELSQWSQAAVQIVSDLPAPSNGGPIYRFLGMPAMRTRWMAGAAAHKSG